MQNSAQSKSLIGIVTKKINAIIKGKNQTVKLFSDNPRDPMGVDDVEHMLDLYFEYFFEALEDSQDIMIPRFGKFLVNGAQQAGVLKFRELLSNGILDRQRLIDEPKKAKDDMYKLLNKANAHTFLKKSEQGKGKKKVYCLSREKLKEFERTKGGYTAKLPHRWFAKLKENAEIKKNIK